MKNLNWWHWVLIVFGGMFVLGLLAGDPESEQAKIASKFEDANAEFMSLAGDDTFVMIFNANADPSVLPKMVQDHCGSREFCKVYGWTNPEFAPRGFPMTDREVEAQVLTYGINRVTGYEEFYWDCEKFGELQGIDCDNADAEKALEQ